ncbi:hypothetical protein THAOC_19586 [Thalassiosira oceanica]|uniref:Protein kinase domain-containing protein n=1 Tax=Thalassiosira oceanica TaxID=159749 RepID=K0SGM2_THAOC|nr:hypothetical protein THAOC_19586 [Thalassiosira oceanica]|eukprot:EJK60121.1 hypothetical protein THAOC_19586 [Thalassiosira oceanica]
MVVTRSGRRALAPVRDTKRGVNQTPLKTPRREGEEEDRCGRHGEQANQARRGEGAPVRVPGQVAVAFRAAPYAEGGQEGGGQEGEEEEVDAAPSLPPPQCVAAAAPTANGSSADESFGSDSTPSLSGIASGNNGAIFRLLPPATANPAAASPTIGLGRQLNSSYDSHGTEASATSAEAREFRAGAVALLREGNLSVEVEHDELVDALLEESFDGEDATHDTQELANEIEKLERIVELAETALEPIETKPSFDEVCPAATSETYEASVETVEEDEDEEEDLPSLDDFEIIGQLGKGGTATVFHAIQLDTGREVALKVVKMEDNGEDVMSEIDIHEDLCHPAIVELVDYFFTYERVCVETDDDSDDESEEDVKSLVMVLELVAGEALFDVIRDSDDGYLPEHVARRYMRDMIESVSYLHDVEIIHSDIKSLNFLVNGSKGVKLCDFGMSVRFHDVEIIGGSPSYMSPEHYFDHRVDTFSLGCILYEMLVGQLPYKVVDEDSDYSDESIRAHMESPVMDEFGHPKRQYIDLRCPHAYGERCRAGGALPPLVFPDHVSSEARNLIDSLMREDPEDRIGLDEVRDHYWFAVEDDLDAGVEVVEV